MEQCMSETHSANIEILLRVLDQHGPRLFLLLKRVTLADDAAEDLLQELFLRLRDSPGFAGADDPPAYASRTALRLAFDWRRKRKRSHCPLEIDPTGDGRPVWTIASDREEAERVLDALACLPRPGRDIVAWRFLDGESYEVIASRLQKTPHQVRALCRKAILRLRRRLTITETINDGRVSPGVEP